MQLVPTISTKLELGTRRIGQIGWSRVWLAETPCVANANCRRIYADSYGFRVIYDVVGLSSFHACGLTAPKSRHTHTHTHN